MWAMSFRRSSSQPDRPAGRGRVLTPTPVAQILRWNDRFR